MGRNYSSERGRVPLNLTTVRRPRWGTLGPSPQLLTKPSVLLARGMGCPQVWRPCSEVRSRAPGEGVLWLCQGIVLSPLEGKGGRQTLFLDTSFRLWFLFWLSYSFYFLYLQKDTYTGITFESKYKLNAKFRRTMESVLKIIPSIDCYQLSILQVIYNYISFHKIKNYN